MLALLRSGAVGARIDKVLFERPQPPESGSGMQASPCLLTGECAFDLYDSVKCLARHQCVLPLLRDRLCCQSIKDEEIYLASAIIEAVDNFTLGYTKCFWQS